MATYTGGLNLKDTEVKKFVNNIISKTVDKAKTAGMRANKELRKTTVIEWFRNEGFPISWHTLYDSLEFEKPIVKQDKTNISIIFVSYFNPSLYEIEDTNLYKQMHGFNKNHIKKYPTIEDPTKFIVEDLQWDQGIIGLPAKSQITDWVNPEFHKAKKSLDDFTTYKYKYNWRKYCNKFWKKNGNEYISSF